MPGNEAADKVYNFFEQENLSQGQDNSQVASANWPVRSNNLWVGNQRQIGTAVSCDTKNYVIQQADSERGNVRQSPQTPLFANNAQISLRPEFAQSQFRNQELSLNGFVHEHQGFQKRQNQAEFLRENELSDPKVSNQLQVASRGLPIIEQQRGNAPEHSPALARTSERLETSEAPINFDFLGRQQQQQLMRNQQPGMSQPRPRQQPGLSDVQLWQQQIMFKQLQELQRQRQLQQLDQETRHQNPMNQFSAIARHAATDQLPAMVNGVPIHDSSNYVWQNELIGGDPKVPNSSQMFVMGNTNWAQHGGSSAMQGIPDGSILSTEQGQVLRSMGLVPQQLDQSLYGAHISNTRGAFNQYSHLQGIPQDCADMLNKASGNQVEKQIMQSSSLNNSLQGGQSALFSNQNSMQDGASVSKQGSQEKNFYGYIPFQGMSSGVQSGNYGQVNSVPRNAPVQEFQGRDQPAGWSGKLQERAASQIGSSQGLVSLDPTEKKILFSSDDNIWDAPGGKGGTISTGGYGDPLERMEHLNVFPSIQSGTWSALMQSAVAEASSSDTGIQDEWSGLSFHKRESSTGNQPNELSDSAKQQTDWADNNLQSASSLTSRPFPLFNDAKTSQNGRNAPDFQQSGTRNLFEQSERMQHDASFESMQQSSKESGKWLDRSPQQGSQPVQPAMNLENAFQRGWMRQTYEQSESAAHATNVALDAQNMQGPWVHQHSMSSYNVSSQPGNKPTAWSNNDSLSASGDATLKISESENRVQRFQGNDLKMGMHMERDHDGGMWKADDNCVAKSFPNFMDGTGSHHDREVSCLNNSTDIPNSSGTRAIQETNQQVLNSHHLNYGKHLVDSPVNYRGEDGMRDYQNQLGSQVHESSMYNSDRGSGETYDKKRENCYQKEFSNDSYNSNQSQPTVTGDGLRENSWLSTSDSRPLASGNQKSTGQVGRKAAAARRFQYHPMGNLEVDVEPTDTSNRVTQLQALSQQAIQGSKNHEQEYFGHSKFNSHVSNSAIAMEKGQTPDFQGTAKGSASSDGSAGTFPQSKRTVQTCQNMLELFHKVDQSREQGISPHFSSSDRIPSSVMPEAEGSDASIAHQWRNQSAASQGFGLRLAPPSQRPPVTNHALPSQNSSQIINGPNSRQVNSKVGALPHDMSQREHWDNNPVISAQTGNETSQSNMQANFSAAFTSPLPQSRNQLQSLQMSRAGRRVMNNPSVNVSDDRLASHFRQTHGNYGEVVAAQSAQVSLPGTNRTPPFIVTPPEDTLQPESASLSHVRVSGQQFPVLESVPVSRPSAMSGKSQQGVFSTMLQSVWASVSSQQHQTGGPPHKVPPNPFQSGSPSNSNLERPSISAQRLEYEDSKRGGNGSEFGMCSINSQRVAYGEEQLGKESSWQQVPPEKVGVIPHAAGASQGQESVVKHPLDTKSIASGSFVGKDPVLVSQRENVSLRNPATSTRDIEAFGRSLKQAQVLHQNYSLLHQVQAMKGMETDPDKRGGKRFKGADGVADAQQLANRVGQQLLDGCNVLDRDGMDSGLNAAVQNTSFSSGDSKMLSFSTEGRQNAVSQSVLGVVPSQDMAAFGRNDSLNRSSQLSVSSLGSENPQINPKMAPSWFERYGTFKTDQIFPMHDAQSIVKPVSQQFNFGKVSEGLHILSSTEQVNALDAGQIGSVCQSTITTMVPSEHLTHFQSLPSEVPEQTLAIVRPKKRKTETSVLIPWHNEIIHGSQRLQTISVAEQDWAQAANRLIEKLEDEAELAEDGQPMIRPRRRLIFTTQLMQQLFRPAPAAILSVKATSDYETLTYFVAKLALGEACSLTSSSKSDSHSPIVNGNTESGKLKTSERVGEQYFSSVVEDFIGRARKLETDLLRLEKRASIMDIRVECQDLERFSVINRFAKFHGRSHSDAAETSSPSDAAAAAMTQKTCPQRYVTAHAMPRNLPEGVQCLSL